MAFLSGFTDELIKLSSRRDDEVLREVKRGIRTEPKDEESVKKLHKGPRGSHYLASAMVGAAATPAMSLVGKRITRSLHNRDVMKAMKGLRGAKLEAVKKELQTGRSFGRARPDLPSGKRPLMTHADVAGGAAQGALFGSVVQMLRDHFNRPS